MMASLADLLAYQAKRSQYMDDMTEQPSDLEKAVQDQFGMQPNMDRGALLPYKSKDKGWVAPEVAYQLAKLLASPSVAMHGGNISPQEAIESANTLSGFMTPAGLLSKPSPAMARMNVYHGTPHKFEPTPNNPLGEFDASKIGTGEGAAAYGHGIYVAENPAVAKDYQFMKQNWFDTDKATYKGKSIQKWYDDAQRQQDVANRLNNKAMIKDANAKLAFWENIMTHNHPEQVVNTMTSEEYAWPEANKFARTIDTSKFRGIPDPGNLYTVDLPDEKIDQMLDWDKPLSEQSAYVQKVIENLRNDANVSFHEYKGAEPFTGQRLYKTLGEIKQQTPEAGGRAFIKTDPVTISELLRQRGIPGIKYFDAGSRGKMAGTRNFVVFPGEEKSLNILSKK